MSLRDIVIYGLLAFTLYQTFKPDKKSTEVSEQSQQNAEQSGSDNTTE